MRNWWLRLGCFLTGYNYSIIKTSSEASAKAVKKYVSALLIISLLWGFVGYMFTQRYLHGDKTASWVGAVVMVIIIINIERQIILGIEKTFWPRVFRIIIGLVMACIGSVIIDQIIFKDDIEKQQISNIQMRVNELLPIKTKQLDLEILALDTLIDKKETERQLVINEVGRRPSIPMPTVVTKLIADRNGKKVPTSIIVTNQSIANPKANLIPQLQTQIDTLRRQKLEKEESKSSMRKDLEIELRSKTGFLDELTVLFSLLFTNYISLIVWLLWFVFLFAIELFVLVSKFGDKMNDYDQTIIHQRDIRLAMLQKMFAENR